MVMSENVIHLPGGRIVKNTPVSEHKKTKRNRRAERIRRRATTDLRAYAEKHGNAFPKGVHGWQAE